MRLILHLFPFALASQRAPRNAECTTSLELRCYGFERPDSTNNLSDGEIAELRKLHTDCLECGFWGGNMRAFGGECYDCPCWCEARPHEETCNGETRGKFNENIFMPYGDAAGDIKLQTQSLGVHATHTVDHDFLFYAKAYREFHISSHGFIHLRNGETTYPISMSDRYNSYQSFGYQNMIAPFWSDFNMAHDGIVWYRAQYTNLEQLNQIVKAGTNHGLGGSDYNAVAAFIVTWDTMIVTSMGSGPANDRRNTFQTVLTQDASGNSYVLFHYGDIEQDAGSYTSADVCTGLNGWNSWAGISDEFGNEYQLPVSHTNYMEEIEKGSNVNVRGRYMLRVDQEEIVAPPVVTDSPPVVPNLSTASPTNPIDIDNQVKGIKEYIVARAGTIDFSIIENHGCHCSRLGNAELSGSVSVADGLDRLCRNWLAARICCHKTNGLCDGPNEATYDYANYLNSGCTTGTVCQNQVCDIDTVFYEEMETWFSENILSESTNSVCVSTQATVSRDSCCGDSPLSLSPYNSVTEECVDGEVQVIG